MTLMRPRHELLEILVEEEDPRVRALAHLELSWHALRANRRDAAVRHLKEAVELDEHFLQARRMLRELGAAVDDDPGPASDHGRLRGRVGRKLAGLFKA